MVFSDFCFMSLSISFLIVVLCAIFIARFKQIHIHICVYAILEKVVLSMDIETFHVESHLKKRKRRRRKNAFFLLQQCILQLSNAIARNASKPNLMHLFIYYYYLPKPISQTTHNIPSLNRGMLHMMLLFCMSIVSILRIEIAWGPTAITKTATTAAAANDKESLL